ncbi:hypothetical protein WJX73_006796, partial [Symbiochloris irregularis]
VPPAVHGGKDLLKRMLTYDPARRITARDALEHPYFREQPIPLRLDSMPHFPSAHDAVPSHRHNQRRELDNAEHERNAKRSRAPPRGLMTGWGTPSAASVPYGRPRFPESFDTALETSCMW